MVRNNALIGPTEEGVIAGSIGVRVYVLEFPLVVEPLKRRGKFVGRIVRFEFELKMLEGYRDRNLLYRVVIHD